MTYSKRVMMTVGSGLMPLSPVAAGVVVSTVFVAAAAVLVAVAFAVWLVARMGGKDGMIVDSIYSVAVWAIMPR